LLSWPLAASAELELRRRRAAAVGPVIEPFADWLPLVSPTWQWDVPHLRLVQQALARLTAGETGKLMLFLPPRHGKSELVTIRYPVWRLEREPATRVIVGAYNQGLAERFSRRARRIAADRLRLSDERATAADWETTAGGGVRAVGVGSGVTGTGANLIIIDDPVKSREEANSPAYRERVWDWYTDDLYTRREPGAAMLLIQTRWHKDDLAGRILASEDGPNWTVLSLPAEAEADDPLGRALGEPLWPERFDSGALAGIRTVLGSWSYAALYQQRPMPAEGGMFQRHWFEVVAAVPFIAERVRYWDRASTAGDGDYTAGALLARDGGLFYVEDVVRGQWSSGERDRVILATAERDAERYGPAGVRIVGEQEPGSSGKDAAAAFARLLAGYPVHSEPVSRNKELRADPLVSQAEAGNVKVLRAAWNGAWFEELCSFPMGQHDDQVDATAGAFNRLTRRSSWAGRSYQG
jgi:predicted phage terminase large subunit-like protein